jgi:hypothetical protein
MHMFLWPWLYFPSQLLITCTCSAAFVKNCHELTARAAAKIHVQTL